VGAGKYSSNNVRAERDPVKGSRCSPDLSNA